MEVRDPYGNGDVSVTADSYYIDDPDGGSEKVRVTDVSGNSFDNPDASRKEDLFYYDDMMAKCRCLMLQTRSLILNIRMLHQ